MDIPPKTNYRLPDTISSRIISKSKPSMRSAWPLCGLKSRPLRFSTRRRILRMPWQIRRRILASSPLTPGLTAQSAPSVAIPSARHWSFRATAPTTRASRRNPQIWSSPTATRSGWKRCPGAASSTAGRRTRTPMARAWRSRRPASAAMSSAAGAPTAAATSPSARSAWR